MYKNVSITIIMASAIAAILIVPWAALQRSYAQSDFANTILKIHNDERSAVGSPPLKWSDSLAAGAKSWADHLATTGTFDHCFNVAPPTCDLSHEGENLAASASHDPTLGSPANTIKMQQDWVDEKNKWNGSPVTSENMYPIGHYVQMVSPATTAVGCATASGTQNSIWSPPWNGPWDVLVCRYDRNQNGQEPYIAPFLSRGK
ncbi:MAG: CAP domain-containing protein [Candidatus Nitrosopolaris sp.]